MNNNIDKLSALLGHSETPTPVEQLSPPAGLTREQIDNAQLPPPDQNIYIYKDLVDKMRAIPDAPKIPTFIPQLDMDLDGGFQGGELIILSGTPKNGKSTLMQTFSYLQSLHAFPSIIFTLEMPWQELTRKFLQMDQDNVATAPTDLPIFSLIDNRGLSLEWLEEKIKEAQEKHGIAIAYIDHLHYLVSLKDSASKNISFLMGNLARELKRMSMRLNIPIVLLAHTKKIDVNINPDLNSIRDSGLIAAESDFVMFIWREREQKDKEEEKKDKWKHAGLKTENNEIIYTNKAVLALEANRRNGNTRRIRLAYHRHRFYPEEEYENTVNFDYPAKNTSWMNK